MSCKGQRGAWGSPSVVIQGVGGVGVGGKPMPVLCPRCPGMGSCLSGVNKSSSYPTTHMPYVRGPGMAHTRVHRISTPNSPPSPHLGRCPRETPTTVLPSSSCSPPRYHSAGSPLGNASALSPAFSYTSCLCIYTSCPVQTVRLLSVFWRCCIWHIPAHRVFLVLWPGGFLRLPPRTFRGNSA